MATVTATEAKQTFSAVLQACEHEPVFIQKQKRDVAVVLSLQDYQRLTAVNLLEFQRFCDGVGRKAAERGMDEATLNQLLIQDD